MVQVVPGFFLLFDSYFFFNFSDFLLEVVRYIADFSSIICELRLKGWKGVTSGSG